jgi:drug/metabolite transporter (DMT)-like permease
MVAWVLIAITGLAIIVAAVPTVGWPLMLGLGAGCILGGGLVIYRRFSS